MKMHYQRTMLLCAFITNILAMAVGAHPLRTATTVAVYSSTTSGVLDQTWDPNGLANLQLQLRQLGLYVAGVDSFPEISGTRAAAFVIPAASGDNPYKDVEDARTLSTYVKSGGLVIVHGSARHQNDAQDLVAASLDYQGSWQYCELVADSTRSAIGISSVSPYAEQFLSVAWPSTLEDAPYQQVHSWCKHEDPDALSYPLYTLGGDSMKVVAQAFTRVGSSGAVVWLGYSWQDGPQQGWGEMLGRVIDGFHQGLYQRPVDASIMDSYPLRLDAVLDAAASMLDDTAEAVRRLLYGVMLSYSFGSGYYSAGGYYGIGYYGFGGGYYGGYGGYYGGYGGY
ncbi:hypothetical protein VOLCADRAFT_117543, partial [Volvox carteri f. nagariensis]